MQALVILPTYNEIGNLAPMVDAILAQGDMFDVLVIDDGSPDGTGILADHLKKTHPGRVEVIHRQGKLGLATAYLTGFRFGMQRGYDFLFEMDADFSHNPAYLPQFIETMRSTGADLVLGSRYVAGGGATKWPWYRRLISRGGSLYASKMLGIPVRDLTGGFKCFRAQVLESMNLESIQASGYGFQIELTYRAVQAGFKVVEMPIIFEERREGQSKMSPAIFMEAFWMVAKMRAEHQTAEQNAEWERLRP
ncbi:glycosyltransferase [Sulfobacillus harzensis]|uniref:Polyprenol monophosphomannose synthase n=1 Tax=Sulfobacillus harzensis TaxID=2729629 RepID=A0A7Y0L0Z5_9FIRM|nr:polyprenol monophosphomannose synthase [Sulfobacillus harzensis]